MSKSEIPSSSLDTFHGKFIFTQLMCLMGLSYKMKCNIRVGIYGAESGWDCEMICYPFIFDNKEKRYMLYNCNGYGKMGFGLAVLDY